MKNSSSALQVEIAGTKALADMASKNKNNKTKIAEMPEAVPAIMQQLENAEIHQTLTRALEVQAKQRGDKPLMDCLRHMLDQNWLLVLTKLAQEVPCLSTALIFLREAVVTRPFKITLDVP